jgi:subfamily B ATP-binding cassette protein MsbA
MQLTLFPLGISEPLAKIARRYSWSVPIVAVLGFIGNGLEGVGITLLIPFLAGLFGSGAAVGLPGPLGALSEFVGALPVEGRLYLVAGTVFASIVLKAVILSANAALVAWVDGKAGHDIRCALSRQLLNVGYAFHINNDPARLLTIVGTEAWRASDAIRTVFSIIAAAGAVTVFGLILVVIEWRLSLAVFVGVFAIRAIQAMGARRLRAMSHAVSQANRRLSTKMILGVEAARLIRVFGGEKREEHRFEQASEEVRRTMFRVEAAAAPLAPAIEVTHAALFIGILLGAYAAGVSGPVIVAFLVLLYRMQPHLRALSQARINLEASRGSVAEVEWLLDPAGKPAAPSGTIPFKGLDGSIVFDRVSFSYANRAEAAPVLRDASFSLLPGHATALIGRSGAGKSTIVNLFCRLLEPTSGQITVSGINLSEIEPMSWLARVGLAGQDIELIDGSIADNIAYGRAGASQDDVREAARLADVSGFVDALPERFATRVGPRGLSLSGGQRQRIGIARALLRDPDILILDEAMSAVDTISETAIVSLLRGRLKGKTVIVISHRPSTLACCDDGIVLDDGLVIEAGPLSKLGAYKRMVAPLTKVEPGPNAISA